MLLALLRGKSLFRHAHDGADINPTSHEDPLTAAVFSRLSYLPIEVAWELLTGPSRHLAGLSLPQPPAPTGSWEFWPTHRRSEGDGRKEPDVVFGLGASNVVLVVEAKHRAPHSRKQWADELSAARREAGQAAHLVFLAVGADPVDPPFSASGQHPVTILHLDWRDLTRRLLRAAATSNDPPRKRLLADTISAMNRWGYGPRYHLDSLPGYATLFPRPATFTLWNPAGAHSLGTP